MTTDGEALRVRITELAGEIAAAEQRLRAMRAELDHLRALAGSRPGDGSDQPALFDGSVQPSLFGGR